MLLLFYYYENVRNVECETVLVNYQNNLDHLGCYNSKYFFSKMRLKILMDCTLNKINM